MITETSDSKPLGCCIALWHGAIVYGPCWAVVAALVIHHFMKSHR